MQGLQFVFFITFVQFAIGETAISNVEESSIEFHATSTVNFDSSLGPISSVLQSMASNTAEVNDEIVSQINTKFERILTLLHGNTEIVVGDAMVALADSLLKANAMLSWQNCSQSWTIAELYQRIDEHLAECTQKIVVLQNGFQAEMTPVTDFLQSSTEDIIDLANICYTDDMTFAASSTCFVQKLGKINELITTKINLANYVMMRTRKQGISTVDEAKQCASKVVADVMEFLDISFERC